MYRLSILCLLGAAAAAAQPAKTIDLMPDESLKGWTRVAIPATDGLKPTMQWRVDKEQNALICSGLGGHEWLRMDQELGDYVLELDWRFTPRTPDERRYNSGVGIRLSSWGELWVQAQTGLAGAYLFGTNLVDGAIKSFNLRNQMKENRVKPAGEWNHFIIRVQGDTVTLDVNGMVVSEVHGIALRRGYIGLEAEGFEVAFRNIKLTPLE
jgi:hypothetical protein